jgi:hypothetical protein
MKFHTQNPWTRKPSIMINLTEDEARAITLAISHLGLASGRPLDPEKIKAATDLQVLLLDALNTPKPNGLGGPGRY